MAYIKPFHAIRPKKGLEDKIAALPYDVYNRVEAKAEVLKQPMSFLKIDRPETQFDDSVDTYADCVYEKAHDVLWEMVQNGEFVKEEKACYYVYELIMHGRSQTGLTACASIDDYVEEVIKKHENTRADKEVDRIRHVSACNAQTGPIFLAYRSNQIINQIVKTKKQETPLYDFTCDDGVTHRVWVINELENIEKIQKTFEKIGAIYIADGHHRCASAVKVGLQKREENKNYDGTEEYNFFLSVLFPDEELMIMDYNRVIKDLNNHEIDTLITEIKKNFEVEKKGGNAIKPACKGEISMYLEKEWYLLKAKEKICSKHPVEGLDVSILQKEVLDTLFSIKDPKTDTRIDFVGGIRGLLELERRVHTDCKVAFAMYPTDIAELFAVSDAGLLMPPKSTWFEPKLRSGLFIHSIND